MKVKDILNQTGHRPFDYPLRSWKYYQEWNNTLFFHWNVEPELIEPFLPKGMQIDLINGKTWISLVAFDMNNIGIKKIPKLPHISDFQEINIRTYVIYNEKPSVYFLNMEGSKRTSCSILKALSRFPYRYSKMKRNSFSFESKNTAHNDSFYTEYRLGDTNHNKDKTDIWLTERYAVFQDYKKSIIEYDVHHLEWPMQNIDIKKLEVNYPRFNHIINNTPDRIHYSKGVKVLTWGKRKHQYE